MKKFITALILTALVSACSSTETMTRQEKNLAYQDYITKQQLPSLDKVRTFKMRGWQALSDEFLIVSAAHKKQYLLELEGFCPDFDFSQGIVIKQSNHSSLTTKFDSVAALNAPGVKCFIKAIHPVTREQVQELTAIGKPEAA
ncbi:hypothetical protein SG34_000410 [Thalassomonas viridans]|uniref:Lipoprotein n=1 Tax=Thalassomonas viridans TaxID=137584 RepID=A0AAE9Z2N2_9GAMM|nr:DUF6491 family protein [Thalassomonas viridans]WDE05448.1 hypothetical protein SG34_000410 [Thalassomonas viridans]